jgi:hypothetical protein
MGCTVRKTCVWGCRIRVNGVIIRMLAVALGFVGMGMTRLSTLSILTLESASSTIRLITVKR